MLRERKTRFHMTTQKGRWKIETQGCGAPQPLLFSLPHLFLNLPQCRTCRSHIINVKVKEEFRDEAGIP